ncbi:MAG: efflux RND transporter periplasmic adaptor subunit [Synergistaceae bacterium]|jgi:HlyD family secretion protein|nr:efflux RND transporter periplasmic adaptor subunit [Synergistaceae bacterium]MCE5184478.1 efflux RND transporter periplasmic adaptor subunit [Synergistaceae bacterium]
MKFIENKISKKLKGRIMAVILVLIVISGGLFWYYSKSAEEIQYKTVRAERSDLRSVIQATGTLDAVETVDVGTQISGTVKEIYIDYNSVVKQGQLIAEIDSATQRTDVAQAEANLQVVQADLMNSEAVLANAEKSLARTRKLAEKDLIAKADVDTDEKTYLTAKAQVAASRARIAQYNATLNKTKINLGYTQIYSPVDGVVVAKNVEKGQTVAASYQTPSIAEIAKDLGQMQVEVNVDEADIGGVKEGQKATFTVDAHPNDPFDGVVTQVRLSPKTTDNVVTYVVIVKVSNNKGLLMPGMTANVSLIVEERKDVVVVPNSAFRFKPADPSAASGQPGAGMMGKQTIAEVKTPAVYVPAKKAPVRVEVKRGISDGQNTEIISGLSEGDEVITGIIVPNGAK